MIRQPEIRPQMVVVSDMHLKKEQSSQDKLHNLVNEIIARPNIHVLVLPGDIVDKSLCREGVDSVVGELARLTDSKVGKQVVYVEGNDEQHIDPLEVREKFYHQLEEQGVTVFRAGQNNYTTVKDANGRDSAALIGVPWTLPPEVYDNIYFGTVDSEFLANYRKAAYDLYGEPFLEDLQHAEQDGLPAFVVCHNPPFDKPYGKQREVLAEHIDQPLRDIINNHPIIVGGFFGHVNNGDSSIVITESGIAFAGVCEEVIKLEGQEYGYLACLLPRANQNHDEFKQQFLEEIQEHEARRTARGMFSQDPIAA